MSSEEQTSIDPDVEHIISGISDLVRDCSESDRQDVLERVRRAMIEKAPVAAGRGPTIESLYIWDLLPKSTYLALQFALNDEPDASGIVWEDRTIGLIEQMLSRPDGGVSRWTPARCAEVAFALHRVAHGSPSVANWCDAVRGRGHAGASYPDGGGAYQRRKAHSAMKLSIRRLRKIEGLSVHAIAQRFSLSPYTVSSFIRQANDLHTRRSLVPNPIVAECRSTEPSPVRRTWPPMTGS